MKNKFNIYAITSLIAGSLLTGCGSTSSDYENETDNDTVVTAPATFTSSGTFDILKLQCSSCHSSGKGGFTANSSADTTYSSMKSKGFTNVLYNGNGANGHDGGDQLDVGLSTTIQYNTILNWINAEASSVATTITVERGPVFDANVTDSKGNIAKMNLGTNTYTFDLEPTYPIKAVGGWIDVDGDGNKTVGTDVILDIELTSYSNLITPVTTYIGDFNKDRTKLNKLINDLNTSESELLKKPSEADYKAIITQNSLYKIMKENNTTELDDSHFDDINTSYHELEITYKQSYESQDKTSEELSKLFEENVMDDLEINQHINRMDENEKAEFETLEIELKKKNKNDNSKDNEDEEDDDNESEERD